MNGRLLTLGVAAAIAATAVLTGCDHKTTAQPRTSVSVGGNPAPSSPAASGGPGSAAPGPGGSPSAGAPGGAPMSPGPTGRVTSGTTVKVPLDGLTVSADGRTLNTTTEVSGCETAQLVTDQSSARVTVTLETVNHHKAGQMCPALARMAKVSITLSEPLGHREVFDGVSGRNVTPAT